MGKIRRLLAGLYGGISIALAMRLLAVPFGLSLIDLAVTLYFQPDSYWNGDRSTVVEGNPIARWAFSFHPLLIVPGFVGWYALVIPLIFKTPAWIGLRIHVFLVLGHGIMISGWLIRYGQVSWWVLGIGWGGALLLDFRLIRPFLGFWNEEERELAGKSFVLSCQR